MVNKIRIGIFFLWCTTLVAGCSQEEPLITATSFLAPTSFVSPEPTETLAPSVTPSPVPTPFGSDWLNYQLPGLALKFPPDWEIISTLEGIQASPLLSGDGQPAIVISIQIGAWIDEISDDLRTSTELVGGIESSIFWDYSNNCALVVIPVGNSIFYAIQIGKSLCEGEPGQENLSQAVADILDFVSFIPNGWVESDITAPENLISPITYSDLFIGYSIDYPLSWFIYGTPGSSVILQSFPREDAGTDNFPSDDNKIDLNVRSENPNQTLEEMIEEAKNGWLILGDIVIVKEEQVILASGLDAVRIQTRSSFGEATIYFAEINGTKLSFSGFGNDAQLIEAVINTLRPLSRYIVVTPPYFSCVGTAVYNTSPPKYSTDILIEGYSSAAYSCDAERGALNYNIVLFGGRDGSILEPPNYEATVSAGMEIEFNPSITGSLRVDATISVNSRLGVAAGSATALPESLDLLDFLLPEQLTAFIDIAKSIIAQPAAGLITEAFLTIESSNLAQTTTKIVGGHGYGASFPLLPWWQDDNFNSEEILISMEVPVTSGDSLFISTGIQTNAYVHGWATAYWNVQSLQESFVTSVSITQVQGE